MRIDFIFEIIHPLEKFHEYTQNYLFYQDESDSFEVEKPRILITNVICYVRKLVRTLKSLEPLSLQFLVNFQNIICQDIFNLLFLNIGSDYFFKERRDINKSNIG